MAKKSIRKALITKLDGLASFAVRLRDKSLYNGICPLCGMRPQMCAFHFLTRSKQSVRWDMENLVASCSSCNLIYEHDQTFILQVVDWYRKTHGVESWDNLVRRSHIIVKRSDEDLRVLAADLQTLISKLGKSQKIFG